MSTVAHPILRRIARVLLLTQSAALVLVIVATAVLVDSARRYGEANDWVAHTQEVLDQLNQLRTNLLRGGVAVRNYALAPQSEALQRLRASASDSRRVVDDLQTLVRDNDRQARLAVDIAAETYAIASWYLDVATVAEREGASAARRELDARVGNDAARRLRQLLDTMEQGERQLLTQRRDEQARELLAVKRSAIALAVLFIGFMAWTMTYASRLVRAGDRDMAQLATTADTDVLTGLANRRSLERRARELIGRPMSVIVFDLDDFKPVNDRFGHAAGDEVLRAVGRRVRAICRDADLPARVGGDEFVLLFPGALESGRLDQIRQRLLQAISEPIAIDDGSVVVVGASIGYAVGNGPATFEQLLETADDRSYEEKKRRKGAVTRRAPINT